MMGIAGMVLGLFGGGKNYLMMGGVALVVVMGLALGVQQYRVVSRDNTILKQESHISDLVSEVAVQDGQIRLKDLALQAVQDRATESATELENVQTQLEAIRAAPETDNGPIAPVLRRALGMSNGTANKNAVNKRGK